MQQLELEKLGSSPGYVCVSGKDTHFSEPQFLHLKNGNKTCASLLIKQSKLRVIKTQFYAGPGTCSKLPFC